MKEHIKIKVIALLLFSSFPLFAQSQNSLRSIIDSLNTIAYDKPNEVLITCDSLIASSKQKGLDKEVGLLLQIKGVAETSLGNNKAALEYHIASYRIFDSINYRTGIIYSLCNIAAVYINTGDFKKAEDYLLRALAITAKTDDNNLRTIYGNLGIVYENTGKPEKAIGAYQKAIVYLTKLNDHNGLAITYHNISQSYRVLNNFRQAELYGRKALELQKKSGSTDALAMISLALGDIYTNLGKFDLALGYLEAGGTAARELNSPYYKDTYYEYKAEWHRRKGEHKEEAGYLYELLALRDTMHADEMQQINSALEEKFQNDLKSKEIALLRSEKNLAEAKTSRNRVMWIVSFIIAGLAITIAFVAYRNYQLKKKANITLGKEKSQLEEQKLRLENENILVQFETLKNQISPHFLFNSLNALAIMIKQDPDKALEFTAMFSKIFRSILELKSETLITLSEELHHVHSYIYLQKMRFGDNFRVDIDISKDHLNYYIPPFALQMVVENAIKHNIISIDTPLQITISVNNEYLVISNNLQKRQEAGDSTNTGISNIKSRYKYLEAPDAVFMAEGTDYIVKLPLIKSY
jgi:tetratricopeptide (TPR) repeat protein